jgi:hypothetical protein
MTSTERSRRRRLRLGLVKPGKEGELARAWARIVELEHEVAELRRSKKGWRGEIS